MFFPGDRIRAPYPDEHIGLVRAVDFREGVNYCWHVRYDDGCADQFSNTSGIEYEYPDPLVTGEEEYDPISPW